MAPNLRPQKILVDTQAQYEELAQKSQEEVDKYWS